MTDEPIPLARPLIGEREKELVLETLRSRHARRSGRGCRSSRRRSPRASGAEHVSAVSSGTAALHLAIRAAGVERGDEVVTTPFSFVASANCLLYESAEPGLLRHRPAHAEHRPAPPRPPRSATRTTGLLPVHIFGYPADMPAFEQLAADRGLWIVEDACEALGAVHADGTAVGRPRQPRHLRLLPEQAADHGGGGRAGQPSAEVKERDRQRAQPGPRARHGLARPRPAGLQLPPLRHRVRARPGPARAPRRHARRRARGWRALYGEALAGVEGLDLPCPDAGGDRRSWFVYVVQLPRGVDRDADDQRAARARRRLQALPAGDPPHELLPRALRAPRGRVPGVRGRGRALAGPAVLPRADRGRGRRGSRRRSREPAQRRAPSAATRHPAAR